MSVLKSSSSPIRRLTSFSFFSLLIEAMVHLFSCNCLNSLEWIFSELLIFPVTFYPETLAKQAWQLDWSPAAGLHKAIAAIFNCFLFIGLSKVPVVSGEKKLASIKLACNERWTSGEAIAIFVYNIHKFLRNSFNSGEQRCRDIWS